MKKGTRGMKKSKVMLIVVAFVVVCIAGIAVFGMGNGKTQETGAAAVQTVEAKVGDVSQEVDASGTIESNETKTYFSPVDAKIDKMDFKVGDTVKKGAQLISFNLDDLETADKKAELTQKSGELDYENTLNKSNKAVNKQAAAAADADELQGMVDSQEAYVYDLKSQLAQVQAQAQQDAVDAANQAQQDAADAAAEAQKEYEQQIKEAKAEVEKAKKKCDVQLKEKRNAELALSKDPENTDLILAKQEATYDYEDAQATLQDAQTALSSLQENPPAATGTSTGAGDTTGAVTADTADLEAAIEQASSDLAELQSELATKQAEADADPNAMTAEEAEKMKITNNLAELDTKTAKELVIEGKKGIQAEFNGVISDSKVVQGAMAAKGTEMFTIANLDDVSVNLNISKYDYDKLEVGQKAEVTLSDNTYKGTVSKISKIATKNEKGAATISVLVKIDNPDENIFIGVDAKATIQAKSVKGAVIVPVEVVNIGKEGSFCYVIEDGVIKKQNVETGISSDTYVEVTKGLKKGDQVITDIGDHAEGDAVTAEQTKSE